MTLELQVVRASEIEGPPGGGVPWLLEGLWGGGAVGVIGGAPKCCKSWLALEMAVAVASGRPCLGRFPVERPGPALVFAAEDAPVQVRQRLENLAQARGANWEQLEVRLIVESSLRLDRQADLGRLRATLDRHRPRLLVLDPYVRLQRADENNATEVAAILGALRDLSRTFALAIVLVHHARKGGDLGEGLRGSSDFHAWGDSNLYLRRRREGIVLSIEHRAAASPEPLLLSLVADAGPVRLEIQAQPVELSLVERLLRILEDGEPRRLEDLRQALRARKQDVSAALRELEAARHVVRSEAGYRRPQS
jgi:hypothetical protein